MNLIVVHSRDDKELGVAHKEKKQPKNQPQFSQTTTEQYCVGKTKLQIDPKWFQKFATDLKNHLTEFSSD